MKKIVWLNEDTHQQLDIYRAQQGLKTFNDAVADLLKEKHCWKGIIKEQKE